MLYYSTSKQSPDVDFREAAIRGQAPDKGLYFPREIPKIDPSLLSSLDTVSDADLAFRVIRPFVGSTIPDEILFDIAAAAIDFPIPLVELGEGYYSLELFHGPTLAFKDVGARFMSRCLGYFLKDNKRKVTVLVATSGDTGGAVASGFHNVEGVEVVILYPSGKVSPVQEKQLTTLGGNIRALEVQGSFDDCQAMVKQAFLDPQLNEKLFLTSANSINVARWLPQQFYYLLAAKQWKDAEAPVICVPSGNFGNICAGLMTHAGGLPVQHFVAACNANDVVTRYLHSGNYEPRKAVATLSNAMDVGEPSNFIRIQEIFAHKFSDLSAVLSSYTVSDAQTVETLKEMHARFGYTADPHGAVAFHALEQYRAAKGGRGGIFLETAHPVKFPDAIEDALGIRIPVPDSVKTVMTSPKTSTVIPAGSDTLKNFLLS